MVTSIKEIDAADIPRIIQLLTNLYLELGEEKKSIAFLSEDLLSAIIKDKRTTILKAQSIASEIIGFISLTESQAIYAGGNYGVIDEMYVVEGYRSKDIGKLLVQSAIDLAKSKNWKRLDVTAPTNENNRTLDFYKKNGFVFTGPKLKLVIDSANAN